MQSLTPQQLNPRREINEGVHCIETVIQHLIGYPTTETIQDQCSAHLTRILREEVNLAGNGFPFKAPGFDISHSCGPTDIDYYIGEHQV